MSKHAPAGGEPAEHQHSPKHHGHHEEPADTPEPEQRGGHEDTESAAGQPHGHSALAANTDADETIQAEAGGTAQDEAGSDGTRPHEAAPEPAVTVASPAKPARGGKLRALLGGRKGKLLLIGLPVVLLAFFALTAFTPLGYLVYSFRQTEVAFTLEDETYKIPLEKVTVTVDGHTQEFSGDPPYKLKLKPGKHAVKVSKEHYESRETTVTVKPFGGNQTKYKLALTPTGLPVFVTVNHTITKAPVEDVEVKFQESTTKTDKEGKALLIIPVGEEAVEVTVSKDKFNESKQKVTALKPGEKDDDKNVLTLTPAGKIYFLSKRTGKIDVMKSNLDGTDAAVVIAGTGHENEHDTQLLASTDWKYLAFKSRREGKNAKVYVIDTGNDKMIAADEGDADFTLYGWTGHFLAYQVTRNVSKQAERYKLKTYDAETNKITLLDKSEYTAISPPYGYNKGSNYWSYDRYVEDAFSSVVLAGKQIFYTKAKTGPGASEYAASNQAISVKPDGSGKKVIKELDYKLVDDIQLVLWEPHELYVSWYENNAKKRFVYELEIGGAGLQEVKDEVELVKFNGGNYPTFLESPSGLQTFWGDERDGKTTLFVGNDKGEDGKQIASLSEYGTYGWFTDDYLLVSKKGSELYIMPARGDDKTEPIKITDYHRPSYSIRGYGGGYGGL